MSKTPKLRFKEFSGDWESENTLNMLKERKGSIKIGPFGSALKKEFYVDKGIKVYAQENVFKNNFELGDYYITDEKYETLKSCELVAGDLVISMMGTIGSCAIFPESAKKGIMNSHLLRLQFKDEYSTELIAQLLKESPLIKKQIKRLSVGSIMEGLSSSVVQQLIFTLPDIKEQEKIASFFSLIDKKISLQSEKVEALKDYKKGMMQKIFSRELRFKDDDGRDYPEWEEKKITEVAKTSIGLVTTMTENYVEDGVKLIRNSDIKENKIKKDNLINLDIEFAAQNEHRKLKINDVVTVHTGDIGTSAVIDKEMDGCLGFATLNTRPDNKIIDSHYLCHYFNSFRNKKYAIRMSTGDGRSNYNLKDFNNAKILIPCIEEQKKIVNVLSNIDLKLEKEQEKLDSLKQYKKGLLQQMFV